MSDAVNHPAYYGGEDNPYEVLKVAEAWGLDKDAYLFNVIKYVGRPGKGSYLEDLRKAQFYLARRIGQLEEREAREQEELKARLEEREAREQEELNTYEYVTVFTPDARDFCSVEVRPDKDTVEIVAHRAAKRLRMPPGEYTLATWAWYEQYAAAVSLWKEDVIIGTITPALKKGSCHLRLEEAK